MQWEYQVVPFEAQAEKKKTRQQAAADQFGKLLAHMEQEGYEYYRMDHYSVRESAGCLGALSGQKDTFIPYDVAIFRRRVGNRE